MIGWIVSVCFHEFGHAIVAYWGGDTSVKEKGYLTLNPLKYTDPGLSLMLPVLFLLMGGIALPGAAVYIDHRKLRDRWWKSAVSAAGPIASILVTLVLTIPFWLGLATSSREQWIWPALAFLIILEISAVLFNLLPIPPLDGYGIIEPWLPDNIQRQLRKVSQYGMIALFMALWFVQPLNRLFWDSAYTLGEILGVPLEMVAQGYSSFTQGATILLVAAIAIFLLLRRVLSPHKIWYEKGNRLLESGQYDKAIASYDKAIQLKPDDYNTWFKRGLALGNLQRHEDAIASYDKAIQLQPDDPNLWTNRGIELGLLQRYDEAIASCDSAIQIHPETPYAWYNKAGCYAEQGHINLALESLKQAINLEPNRVRNYAKTDSSFDKIRNHELFKQLIGS
jgi:tetratricopeptide (TPR) repeat protein